MAGDAVDDSRWEGGTIVPWSRGDCIAQQVAPGPMDALNSEPNCAETLSQEVLSEFEALMLGEVSNDGWSGYGTGPATPAMSASASSFDDETYFPFMDLPFEIRLQIYRWVYLMNPIRLTQFAPWCPNPLSRMYRVRAVVPNSTPPICDPLNMAVAREGLSEEDVEEPATEDRQESRTRVATPSSPSSVSPSPSPSSSLLSPWRPYCCIPTAVLQTSRQVYVESRCLPFLENEFVFVNWFSSGLWATRSFMRGLQPWQAQSMRYARLELLSRDLAGRLADEWRDVCAAWSGGLRGLRLKILGGNGGGGGGGAGNGSGGGVGSWAVAGSPQRGAPTVRVRDAAGHPEAWIAGGLKRLRRLRRLEVELAVADWDDVAKVAWCRSLEEALNEPAAGADAADASATPPPRVRVSCVERDVEN
ncbi:hypothetical protein GGS23DRAFT_616845 [Durotheca rogersii]|uniref:uncharacterized protein n=1 Tax=Durotheca rogersii TaxID=419775 RepID=UPI00221E8DBE|nr:uncharacterized protein GGS23DRAFT_616845 [Durotheca rogersii]KAI5865714.1 hypothetical protein GGS23DRAFT_616845 [Durotheca rogersii]